MTRVYISSVINTSADSVWKVIRNFNCMPDWHPAIVESRIEGDNPPDQIGCVRSFRLESGGYVRERLLGLSDYDYSFTYAIIDSPLEVENYVATLKLTPITDGGRTFAEWSADFDCSPEKENDLLDQIGKNVFQTGFDSLKNRFSN